MQRTRGKEAASDLTTLPALQWTPRLIALVIGSSLVQAATVVPVPLIIRQIFDQAIPNGDKGQLVVLGLALIAIMIASAGVSVVLRNQILCVVQRHLGVVRSDVAAALVAAPLPALTSKEEDDIRDVMSQDTLRYSTMVSDITAELIPSIVTAVAISAVLIVMDPILFVVTALLLGPVVVLHRTLGVSLHDRTSDYHRSFRNYTSSISRMLKRAAVTRVHGAQHLELEHQESRVADLETTSVRLEFIRSSYQWSLQSVIVFSALAVLIVGGAGVIDGSRSLGELFAFYAAVSLVRPSLDTTVRSMPAIAAGRMARTRLVEMMDLAAGAQNSGSEPAPADLTIDVDDVAFDYGDTAILRNVSFTVRPGTVTVIRGPNGAGKTTLVRLLCGLHKPTSGEIRVGGHPLDTIDPSSFQRNIGVVFQEAIVAGETVREALSYGDHELHAEALSEALRVTGFDRILASLPDGLETHLGSTGVRLSGGERQRLAIAQALVRKPSLLLLDEPTNHLDAEAVAAVVSGLSAGGPAIIVVTHEDSRRFSPDQIVELPGRSSLADAAVMAENESLEQTDEEELLL